MNLIAQQLNQAIEQANPYLLGMLSEMGRNLFFPKGILSQSAEAKQKAHRLNATIGIATEAGKTMAFDSVRSAIEPIPAEAALTYAPSFGILELRTLWRERLIQKNPSLASKAISLPVVTCGITHAVSVFADLFVDPGDVVVIPDMYWGNYNLILQLRKGAVFSHFSLFSKDGGFDLESFKTAVSAAARDREKIIVLLNFPNNPTGYTITEAEAEGIVAILTDLAESGCQVVVACDDAYFGLFYEPEALQESIFARLCDRHPRLCAVKLDGATKENYVWGLRVGFVTIGTAIREDGAALYDALEKKSAGAVRGSISNASHLSQSIVLRSMKDPRFAAQQAEKFQILKARAMEVKQVVSDAKYADAFVAYPFNSGYFMCLRLFDVDAETLRCHLLDAYGVGLISIGEKNLRVAFSSIEETDVRQLFDAVYQGVEDLRKRP
jgi:aspartate/methionine/tyrosine aminotransferase